MAQAAGPCSRPGNRLKLRHSRSLCRPVPWRQRRHAARDFLCGDARRQRFGPLARAAGFRARCPFGRDLHRRQHQAALPPADQFQIDLRGQLGIEQRAMLGARRQIDAEALAQFVQRIARAGNLALGDFDRVDGARQRNAACGPMRVSSALMNLMSKLALWITSGASPRNSRNSSTTWANSGLSARNSR